MRWLHPMNTAISHIIYFTMNIIFFIITTTSICMMIYTDPEMILTCMLGGASKSLELAVRLFAIYAIWLSIINIMQSSGMNKWLAKVFSPITSRMFKGESAQAQEHISLNLSANMLGVGSVATPLGIKAIECMDDKSGIATDNIILFVVINCTSIQLLPTTIIGLRTASGSINPADIILPSLISTILSSLVGFILCKLCAKIAKSIKSRPPKLKKNKSQS